MPAKIDHGMFVSLWPVYLVMEKAYLVRRRFFGQVSSVAKQDVSLISYLWRGLN